MATKITPQQKQYLIIGAVTAAVIFLLYKFSKKSWDKIGVVEKTWDTKTDEKIKTLHPKLRPIAAKFINTVDERLGKKLRILDGYRTIAEQNELYEKGRSKPGPKVTNAKGGSSYHNYGLAFDAYYMKSDGKVDLQTTLKQDVADIGKELGLEWGGTWKSIVDKPHFQLTKGKTSDLLALVNSKKVDENGYVLV
jgi:hypothetical protein